MSHLSNDIKLTIYSGTLPRVVNIRWCETGWREDLQIDRLLQLEQGDVDNIGDGDNDDGHLEQGDVVGAPLWRLVPLVNNRVDLQPNIFPGGET